MMVLLTSPHATTRSNTQGHLNSENQSQMRGDTKSSESAQYGGTSVKSMTHPDPTIAREESPPAYGAQQRQDALWKGE